MDVKGKLPGGIATKEQSMQAQDPYDGVELACEGRDLQTPVCNSQIVITPKEQKSLNFEAVPMHIKEEPASLDMTVEDVKCEYEKEENKAYMNDQPHMQTGASTEMPTDLTDLQSVIKFDNAGPTETSVIDHVKDEESCAAQIQKCLDTTAGMIDLQHVKNEDTKTDEIMSIELDQEKEGENCQTHVYTNLNASVGAVTVDLPNQINQDTEPDVSDGIVGTQIKIENPDTDPVTSFHDDTLTHSVCVTSSRVDDTGDSLSESTKSQSRSPSEYTAENSSTQTQIHDGTGDLENGELKGWSTVLFHNTHSENIQLSFDRRQARRAQSYCKGICFSHRPIAINERVYLRFAEVSKRWSGVLRLGFTAHDPATLNAALLPKYACPDLTSMPGYWAQELEEQYSEQGTVVFLYVTQEGDTMYGINGEEKGVFFSGVQTDVMLWALVDVYGNTMAMDFIGVDPGGQLCRRRANSLPQGVDGTCMGSPMKQHHKENDDNLEQRRSYISRQLLRLLTPQVQSDNGETLNERISKDSELRTHSGEKPYHCTKCGKRFLTSCSLKRHSKFIHTGEMSYQCSICGEKFETCRILNEHTKRSHTGMKLHHCTICDKRFTKRWHLHLHTRIHTGEKPYHCTECDKKFRIKTSLQEHMRTHTGEKPYQCEICGKRMSGRGALRVHKRTHTGEKPFQCTICDRRFRTCSTLRTHMNVHRDDKQYT